MFPGVPTSALPTAFEKESLSTPGSAVGTVYVHVAGTGNKGEDLDARTDLFSLALLLSNGYGDDAVQGRDSGRHFRCRPSQGSAGAADAAQSGIALGNSSGSSRRRWKRTTSCATSTRVGVCERICSRRKRDVSSSGVPIAGIRFLGSSKSSATLPSAFGSPSVASGEALSAASAVTAVARQHRFSGATGVLITIVVLAAAAYG